MEQDSPLIPESEDASAQRALERLASGWIPQDSAVSDSGDAAIRADLEALALLAYELEPEAPSEGAKARLMAQVRAQAENTAGVTSISQGVAQLDVAQRDPADMTLQHAAQPSEAPVADFRTHPLETADKTLMMEMPVAAGSSRGSGRSGFSFPTLAMAAGLAFCLVGLGYLYGQVNAKNAVIALQQDRLESAQDVELELERTRDDLRRMQDSLAMVTTVAQTAYPLRTAGPRSASLGSTPSGKVFVCGQHQRWYLSLSDLETPPEGSEYHLWFLTEEGVVDAGRFEVRNGVARMQDLAMPDGTHGFQITVEPIGGGEEPVGRTIMIGDRPVKL